MKLYLSGPMTNVPQFNFPLFDQATAYLRAHGYEILSPAEMDGPELREVAMASSDGDITAFEGSTSKTWGDLLARDVKLLADEGVSGIALLPDWEKSKGARLEVYIGLLCNLRLFKLQVPLKGELVEIFPRDVIDDLVRDWR